MFDFLTKKGYPENMCRRKHREKARKLVTLPQNTTKIAHTNETQGGYGERK